MHPRTVFPALLLTSVACGTLAGAASAAPVEAGGGTATWSQANVYAVLPERTFLGHTTRPGSVMMGQSAGTATVSGGATLTGPGGTALTEVGPTSPRGSDQVFGFGFAVATGSVDADARTPDVTTKGTLAYAQYPALPTPPPVLTVTDPRIVVTGTTGFVYASGVGSVGTTTYDAQTPLFTLDAASATFTKQASGAVTVAGLVPTLAKADIFGSAVQYPLGVAGPDRTPNTFGGFAVTVEPRAAAPAPVAAPTPTVAAPTLVKVTLKKAAFAAKRPIIVRVRQRGSWTSLGQGTVQGKTLSIKLPAGQALSGSYVLGRVSASTVLPKSVIVTAGG